MNPRLSTIGMIAIFAGAALFFYKALSRGPIAPAAPANCPAAQLELSAEVKAYIDAKIAALPKGHDPDIANVVSQMSMLDYQLAEIRQKLDVTAVKEEMTRVLKLIDARAQDEKQRMQNGRKSEIKSIMDEIQATCRPPEPSEGQEAEGEQN